MKAQHEFKTKQEYNDYLRKHFAAMAMQGLSGRTELTHETIAKLSVNNADALLKELEK